MSEKFRNDPKCTFFKEAIREGPYLIWWPDDLNQKKFCENCPLKKTGSSLPKWQCSGIKEHEGMGISAIYRVVN